MSRDTVQSFVSYVQQVAECSKSFPFRLVTMAKMKCSSEVCCKQMVEISKCHYAR